MITSNQYYIQAIELFLSNNSLELFKLKKKLNRIEKNLIQARQEIDKRNFCFAIEILLKTSPQNIFLKAEKYFVLASAFAAKSDWKSALLNNIKALKIYRRLNHHSKIFLTTFNISVNFERLGKLQFANNFLKNSFNLIHDLNSRLLYTRQKIVLDKKQNNNFDLYESSVELYKLAMKSLKDPYEISNIECVHLENLIYLEKEEEFLALIEKVIKKQTNLEKARIQFLNYFYKFFKLNQKIPTSMPLVVREVREYELKWKILNALSKKNKTNFKIVWSELCELLPIKYDQNFQINDKYEQTSLFGKIFNKLYLQLNAGQNTNIKLSMPLVDRVNYFLTSSQGNLKLSKEELFYMIYQSKWDEEKKDSFYKMLQKSKIKHNFNIIKQNSLYHLSISS